MQIDRTENYLPQNKKQNANSPKGEPYLKSLERCMQTDENVQVKQLNSETV